MYIFFGILAVLLVWYLALEIKSRIERPSDAQLEADYAALLKGRFEKRPLLRRKFLSALGEYARGKKCARGAYLMAQAAEKRASEPRDKNAFRLLSGMCLEAIGNYPDALMFYEAVCGAEPDFALAQELRALLLLGDPDADATEAWAALLECVPENVGHRQNYAVALMQQNRYDEAESQLKMILAALEEDAEPTPAPEAEVYRLLAMLYVRTGDSERMEAASAEAVARGMDPGALQEDLEIEAECFGQARRSE